MSAGNKLKLKSIENEMAEKIQLSDEEWYHCAKEEFDKENYFDSLKYIVKVTKWSIEPLRLLIQLSIPKATIVIKEKLEDLSHESDWDKMLWGISIGQLFRRITKIKFEKNEVNFQTELLFLNDFLEMQMIINQFEKSNNKQLLIVLRLSCFLIKLLISH